MTGISPDLLRAWERRYDLLEPRRLDSGHRRYTPDDVQVLHRVRELMDRGLSIGEVAELGRRTLLEGDTPPADPDAPADDAGAALIADIVRGAVDLDAGRVRGALDQAFARMRPELAVLHVVEPAVREIGRAWADGHCTVAGEHMAVNIVEQRIRSLLESVPSPGPGTPTAVCAGLPGEEHELAPLLVAWALARHGCRTFYLGVDLPLVDLEAAVERIAPDVVCLSAVCTEREPCDLDALTEAVGRIAAGGTRVLAGGSAVLSKADALRGVGAEVWPDGRSVMTATRAELLGSS